MAGELKDRRAECSDLKTKIEELEDIHALFQEYVGTRRPALDMGEVATGEVWYGDRAIAIHFINML